VKSYFYGVELPLFLFLCLSLLGIFFSIYPYQSYITFLKLIGYVLLFFLVINTVETKKLTQYILWIIILTSIFYSIYGLLQLHGLIDKSFWTEQTSLASRYINSNHFAGFLEMSIFIFIGMLFYLKKIWQKFFIIILSFPVLFAFIYTKSRFGWLSFLIALVIFFILSFKFLKKKRKGIIIFLILSIIILVILSFYGPEVISTRLKQISGTEFQSLIQRLNIWTGTLKAFIHKPWGSGIGTFKYIYPQFRVHSDRFTVNFAHNEYLQTLLELGILGFIFLIWLIYSYFKNIFLSFKEKVTGLQLGLTCALIALLVHSALDFPLRIPSNMSLFTIVAGILFSFSKTKDEKRDTKLASLPISLKRICFFLTFCLLLIFLYLRLYFADTYFNKAEETFQNAKWNQAIRNYKKAIDIISPDSLYFERLGNIYALKANFTSKNKDLMIKKAKYYFTKSTTSNFHNYNAHINLAWIYANFLKDEQKSIYHFKKAIQFNPTDAAYHLNFAEYLLKFGEIDYAIDEYRSGFDFFVIEERGRRHKVHKPYEIFSNVYKYIQDYNKLKNLIPRDNTRLHYLLGNFLAQNDDWQGVEQEFNIVKKLSPENIKFRLRIAAIYEKYGKINQTISEYQQILEIEPENMEAKESLERLTGDQ